MPSGYMCHDLVTALVARPRKRFMKPRLLRWSSSSASLNWPRRMARKTPRIWRSTTRLRTPMTSRKKPDTPVPMSPATVCSLDESSVT